VFDSESPLDRRLLDALNDDGHPAPPEARARVRARLAAVIPAMRVGPGAGGTAGGSSTPVPRSHPLSFLGRRITGLATFAAGAATGVAIYATHVPPSGAPQTTVPDRPVPVEVLVPAVSGTPVPTVPVIGSVPELAEHAAPPTSGLGSSAPRRSALALSPGSGAPVSSARSQPDALEQELLDDARAGLRQGDFDRALRSLVLHHAKYPAGRQAEEGDAMEVEALAQAGRPEEARRAAAAFHARWPGSIHARTVDSSVNAIP